MVRFVEFTNLLGQVVAINPEEVSLIRPTIEGVDPIGGRSTIVIGGSTETVHETVSEIEKKLERGT